MRLGLASRRQPHPRLEIALTVLALCATALAVSLLGVRVVAVGRVQWERGSPLVRLEVVLFAVAVAALIYGSVVYLTSRLGYFLRRARYATAPYETLCAERTGDALPNVIVLIPSYKEDLRTIRQTVLSAALQDYPNRRIVVLVDDPPHPRDPADFASLTAARRLPAQLSSMLAEPLRQADAAAARFRDRLTTGFDPRIELRALLATYAAADSWFGRQAAAAQNDHTDALFVKLVFNAHRDLLAPPARVLTRQLAHGRAEPAEIEAHYRRLTAQFRVEISVFERKRFVNLSHAVNKAANLNSYIGLIGRWTRAVDGPKGRRLVECNATDPGAVRIEDADYVVTLDADSMLAPDYIRRLVAVMETPGNERIAVAQTPYSAIPGAPSVIERIAGATTDLQYIVHQGFTRFGATFWVGANAMLRKTALDDIRSFEIERGHRVAKFIQDRTVIEDTESTIDLVARGWRLHNEPLRLAYSATPPDFGSLLIQRRRWANGGLLIMPKLMRYAAGPRRPRPGPLEFVIRTHYLSSLALSSFSLIVLLLPISGAFISPWLPLAGLPYLLLYWRDLLQTGYRRADIARVYAFNWLLLPVNLAGVLKSLQQSATGAKIPFGRTPKIAGRTAAPAWAVAAEWFLFLYALSFAIWETAAGHWYDVAFTGSTAAAFGYAIIVFIGLRASLDDLRLAVRASARRVLALLPTRAVRDFGAGD